MVTQQPAANKVTDLKISETWPICNPRAYAPMVPAFFFFSECPGRALRKEKISPINKAG